MMRSKELLKEALKLEPEERVAMVQGLLESLEQPDEELDALWAEEASRRLKAYREGRLEGIPMEEVLGDD
jgi:putative addiction module component (TIGR02574 family)